VAEGGYPGPPAEGDRAAVPPTSGPCAPAPALPDGSTAPPAGSRPAAAATPAQVRGPLGPRSARRLHRRSDQASEGLWAVLQISDSAFPAGLFTQSGGLESAIAEGWLPDAAALRGWVADLLAFSVAPLDGRALAACWRAAGSGELAGVVVADRRLEAMRSAREPREGSARSGRRVLALAAALVEGDCPPASGEPAAAVLGDFHRAAARGETPGHHAAVLGVLGRAWGAPLRPLLIGTLFAAASGMLAAAVRLGSTDHIAAQAALCGLRPVVAGLAREAARRGRSEDQPWTAFAPAAEIAAMRHEAARVRLFAT